MENLGLGSMAPVSSAHAVHGLSKDTPHQLEAPSDARHNGHVMGEGGRRNLCVGSKWHDSHSLPDEAAAPHGCNLLLAYFSACIAPNMSEPS